MTISQALKHKNKLVKEIHEISARINEFNSIEENTPVRYDVKSLISTLSVKVDELVGLKTKLHTANQSVYSKIFRMAELKGLVKSIKSMDVREGSVTGHYGSPAVVKKVQLTSVDKDIVISEWESEIESIQEELDTYNAVTMI